MRLSIILTAVMTLGLGACETMQAAKERPIEFTSSDFCLINPEKRKWSIDDTRETIDDARRFNAKWDRLCLNKQVATS